MTIGRPRRWTKESLLLVANQRSQGLSWREIGRELGTSGSRAFELFTSAPPDPRDPVTWTILGGDTKLESLFRKCNRDLPGRPAARARPARQRPHRSTARSRWIARSESRAPNALEVACPHCKARPGEPCTLPAASGLTPLDTFHAPRIRRALG